MKITALTINGFGVWTGLALDDLSQDINVFCGPNEAGKTTLLQFVRSVLYGFSPERLRYLPPVRGGRPGGMLEVTSPHGSYQVMRHNDRTDNDGRAPAVLTAADGTRQPEPLLQQILCNIDETVFRNVFAFGLQEIQELGSLGDTEAAELLFNLTAGLDRVSLVEVMKELGNSRNRLLNKSGATGQIVELVADRDRVFAEIEELSTLTARYGRLATQRNHLDRDLGKLEDEKTRVEHDARCVEIAVSLRLRWEARANLAAQLAELRPTGMIPDGAVERLKRIDVAAAKHRAQIDRLDRRRQQLRAEAKGITINEELCRQAARVEALHEQEKWLATLETRTAELELETEQIRGDLNAEYESLGLSSVSKSANNLSGGKTQSPLALLNRRKLGALRAPMGSIRRVRQELDDAQQEVAAATATAESAAAELKTALAPRGEAELSKAIDGAGNLVAQLNRRVQLGERLGQMEQYQADLDTQTRDLLQRQILPAWTLVGLGAVLVVGVLLLLAGIFMPASITGGTGWVMAIVGLLGLIAGVGAKFFIERSNAHRLEACQKQLNMLQLQIQDAQQQRDQLDQSLPGSNSPADNRLQSARTELSALEELMPLDARRQTALQEAQAAQGRATRAEETLSQAKRRWRDALQSVGLPEKLSPQQVRQFVRRCDHLEELNGRLERSAEELQHRNDELKALSGRIFQLAADTGMTVNGEAPARLLARLFEQLKQQQTLLSQRQTLRDQVQKLRRIRSKREKAVLRLKRRRRELFEQAGAVDEHDFHEKADRRARSETLIRQRDAAQAEIAAALHGQCTEEEIAKLFANFTSETLDAHWDRQTKRLEEIESEIRSRFEKRGRLAEKMKMLSEDRRPAAKQLELATIKQRLKEAVRQWRVLALTSHILEDIRRTYEKERQPATLQEASIYLRRLTQDRYTRVWTPLGEDVLRVDDADGQSLPVEVLSRGTREQLFLSLRLALVSSYASRGVRLPLVLDDVLVNFDTTRAKAAAEVLSDFARNGHQLLVFTCHDHILDLFKSLKVRVSRLPDNSAIDVKHRPVAATVEMPQKPASVKRQPKEKPVKTTVAEAALPKIEPPKNTSAKKADSAKNATAKNDSPRKNKRRNKHRKLTGLERVAAGMVEPANGKPAQPRKNDRDVDDADDLDEEPLTPDFEHNDDDAPFDTTQFDAANDIDVEDDSLVDEADDEEYEYVYEEVDDEDEEDSTDEEDEEEEIDEDDDEVSDAA